jgi:translation initiation factor eIF-2B subunit beta
VISFLESDIAAIHNVDVVNPAYDYVSPNLITLFVTENGGMQPSYIYRILQENYHAEDYDL